jgi:hypothetical protein
MLPPAYLSKKLTQPLPIKGGAVLRTIGDAASYVLASRKSRPSTAIAGAMLPSSSLTRR